ncbi:MAG: hypothetical protein RMM98_10465 [Acidobacteriota bacterium]|nr:hypothetical protein [Acidobacteriota bacterium]
MRMLTQVTIWYVVSVISVNGLVSPASVRSAEPTESSDRLTQRADERQRALSTVAYIAELVPTVPQVAKQVIGYSLIGEILWRYDRDRARHYFRHAFAIIDKLTVNDPATAGNQQARVEQEREQKHQLRLEVLRRVAPLDRDLERELIEQINATQSNASADLSTASELIELATMLVEHDPEQAAQLATDSLRQGVASDFGTFLNHLRQSNPDSASQLFDQALRVSFENQHSGVEGLLSLLEFAFPPGSEDQPPAASTINPEQASQLLDVLASRLTQRDSSEDIVYNHQGRSASSATDHATIIQQSLPLFERYAPEHVPALENVSHARSAQPVAQRSTSSEETASHDRSVDRLTNLFDHAPAVSHGQTRDQQLARAAITAAHHRDAEKAYQMLSRIRDRVIYQHAADTINAELALQAIAADDFIRTRHYIAQISQLKRRVAVALLAMQKLSNQGQSGAALFWLEELYQQATQSSEQRDLWQTLFPLTFAALRLESSRAFDIVQFTVTVLNRADPPTSPSPASGLEQSSLQQYVMDAFDALGDVDMDRALYLAMQLNAVELRMLAQLAVCRRVLVGN